MRSDVGNASLKRPNKLNADYDVVAEAEAILAEANTLALV
jgi:hypothetical protein